MRKLDAPEIYPIRAKGISARTTAEARNTSPTVVSAWAGGAREVQGKSRGHLPQQVLAKSGAS